jgi:molybdate transport system substrate-binding protein
MVRLFVLFFLLATSAYATPSRNLTIFAEPNIAIPLTKIARHYSRAANVIVSLNFSSANSLMNNIDSGEPADIFISAHSSWIEMLHQKGVVDIYNVAYIAQDELVLVAQKDNADLPVELSNKNLSTEEILNILDTNKATVILDEEGSSSGLFGKNILAQLHLENIKIFSRLAEDKTSLLTAIKSDKKNYSILLNSQIYGRNDFQILAKKTDEKIFYQALVIAGDNMEVAREFLKFLKSAQAKEYFKSYGFIAN